jgi:hypothetical protein
MPLSVFVLSFGIAGAALAGVAGHSTVPASAEVTAPVLADGNCAGYCVNDRDDGWPHHWPHHWHPRWDRPDYNGYDYNGYDYSRHDHNPDNHGIIVFND